MWDISINPKRACGYAPFIMYMIEKVTGRTYIKESKHEGLTPQVPSAWTPSTPAGPSTGAPPPPTRASSRTAQRATAPSSSRSSSGKRSGIMKMFKSIFGMCRDISVRMDHIQETQKVIMDKLGCDAPPSPPPPADRSYSSIYMDPTVSFTPEEMTYFGYSATPPFDAGVGTSGGAASGGHIHFADEDAEIEEQPADYVFRPRTGKAPAAADDDEDDDDEDDDDDDDYEDDE